MGQWCIVVHIVERISIEFGGTNIKAARLGHNAAQGDPVARRAGGGTDCTTWLRVRR
jgi:hypothetical protein